MKKIIAISLILCLCFSFSGCLKQKEISQKQEEPYKYVETEYKNDGFTEMDYKLNDYLNDTHNDENYMYSPLSFKYAMALACVGANGDNQKELLNAIGFNTLNECKSWVDYIQNLTHRFNENASDGTSMLVANSIWHNMNSEGTILDSYKEIINKQYFADVFEKNSDSITKSVNDWVNENTNGMIKDIISEDTGRDLSTILVNTLYLKDRWATEFIEGNTKEDDFTTIDGKTVKKEMMNNEGLYNYYSDDKTEIAVIHMSNGMNMAFVLGDTNGICEKLKKAESKKIKLTIPKFSLETNFNNGELISYLSNNGVKLAFDKNGADFSNMIKDGNVYIDDIIQKTNIDIDENGCTASAATAIIMENTAAIEITPAEIHFNANKPFSFYIYNSSDSDIYELLFAGKIVK